MARALQGVVKGLFRRAGWEIRRAPSFRPLEWLVRENIGTIFDIGANTGQFARYMHELLPTARIYSFEPLAQSHAQLLSTMSGIPQFRAFRLALSDTSGRVPMYRNRFTPSSSLLPMEQLHREAFPHTEECGVEWIDARRLDDIVADLEMADEVLVKIDVQGAEDKVLRGGETVLSRASIVILETTFRALYAGQLLFPELYDILRERGFAFRGGEEPVRDPRDGSILQCDSIFVRSGVRGLSPRPQPAPG